MPSEKVLEVKKQQVAALKERIQNSCAGVIVNYEGISVADDTKLRKELREAGVEYTVIKNTLIRLALDGTGLEGMDSVLEGTSAIATSKEDYVAAARILGKYEEQIKTFKMKSGFIDKDVIGEENSVSSQSFLQEKFCLLLFSAHSTRLSQPLLVLFRLLLIRAVKLRQKKLPRRLPQQRPLLPQKQKHRLLNNFKIYYYNLSEVNYHGIRESYCYDRRAQSSFSS